MALPFFPPFDIQNFLPKGNPDACMHLQIFATIKTDDGTPWRRKTGVLWKYVARARVPIQLNYKVDKKVSMYSFSLILQSSLPKNTQKMSMMEV